MKNDNSHGTIQVSGRGAVTAPPDEALVQLSVLTEAKTAVDASTKNATITQAVVDAVSAQPNHGVTTTGLSVRPVTTYDPNTRTSTITSFRATNSVNVRTKVGYAGQIFDAGIGAGANQSSGIDFRLQNDRPQREEALRIAVKQAYADAGIVATTANVELDGPESIDIDPGGGQVVRSKMLRLEATATPVLPDDLTVSASVRIVFRTQPK